jgi:hypothetical protein
MKKSQALELEVVTEPDWPEKFSTARQYQHMVKMSFAQGAAFMILCGAELARLKRELGETRGGDHSKSFNVETFADMAERHAGVSKSTAWRYEQMFQCAKKRIPLLNAEELLTTPLGMLPELKQQKLLEAVNKVTDGHTAQQLMWDWGIARKRSGNSNPTPGPARKLSADEQTALLKELALSDSGHLGNVVATTNNNFFLLDDLEVNCQIAVMEHALKLRHAWVTQPKSKRDWPIIEKLLKEK